MVPPRGAEPDRFIAGEALSKQLLAGRIRAGLSSIFVGWLNLRTNATPEGVIEHLNLDAAAFPLRFYQAVTVPLPKRAAVLAVFRLR
jgi:hypothetical protein